MSIKELNRSGRKFGAATYSYSARKIGAVNSDNPKVLITARNDITGALIMDERTDLKTVRENGLPLPSLRDLTASK